MTLYNREQLMVLCALLALMLGRVGWQMCAPQAPEVPHSPRKQYVYEVAGTAGSPGIYSFDSPQQPGQLLDAAGAGAQLPDGVEPGRALANGSRIVVGTRVTVESMSAQARINFFLPVSLTAATAEDLALIPGMGAKTAQAIVEYRDRNGGIRDIAELRGIGGIGPKKFELLSTYLTVENYNKVKVH
jgi:competence protein ComEA